MLRSKANTLNLTISLSLSCRKGTQSEEGNVKCSHHKASIRNCKGFYNRPCGCNVAATALTRALRADLIRLFPSCCPKTFAPCWRSLSPCPQPTWQLPELNAAAAREKPLPAGRLRAQSFRPRWHHRITLRLCRRFTGWWRYSRGPTGVQSHLGILCLFVREDPNRKKSSSYITAVLASSVTRGSSCTSYAKRASYAVQDMDATW